ncbi:MAG: methyltransferase domain-containing protein [Bdellovibrionota bacterium]
MKDLSESAWNQRYADGNTPWDLAGPTPEFQRLTEEKIFPQKGVALVPGGGQGHDAVLLAKSGLEVDLVDFAPLAITRALELAHKESVRIYTYRQDFFALPSLPFHRGRYDLMLEYTFFCAIDPGLRARYVETAAALIKPGGLLVGLFFPLSSKEEGPPFVVKREEVEELFRPYFDLKIETPQRSIKPRDGREFLGIFTRKKN